VRATATSSAMSGPRSGKFFTSKGIGDSPQA
jgi:hypothetical protein